MQSIQSSRSDSACAPATAEKPKAQSMGRYFTNAGQTFSHVGTNLLSRAVSVNRMLNRGIADGCQGLVNVSKYPLAMLGLGSMPAVSGHYYLELGEARIICGDSNLQLLAKTVWDNNIQPDYGTFRAAIKQVSKQAPGLKDSIVTLFRRHRPTVADQMATQTTADAINTLAPYYLELAKMLHVDCSIIPEKKSVDYYTPLYIALGALGVACIMAASCYAKDYLPSPCRKSESAQVVDAEGHAEASSAPLMSENVSKDNVEPGSSRSTVVRFADRAAAGAVAETPF